MVSSWLFKGQIKYSKIFQGCFNSVSIVFQLCFNCVSIVFQECFKSVSRVFQECFKMSKTDTEQWLCVACFGKSKIVGNWQQSNKSVQLDQGIKTTINIV